MGKKLFVTLSSVATVLISLLWGLVVAAEGQPTCDVQKTSQDKNHAVFDTAWNGGSPTGTYPFNFGDGSGPNILTGVSGTKELPHDFSYNVGGVVTWTSGFTVYSDGGVARCDVRTVIDDRPVVPVPTMTQRIFLPVVVRPLPPSPPASLDALVGPRWNHVNFHLMWDKASEDWHGLNFGDGSFVLVYGPSGDMYKEHDYPYPGGIFSATLIINGQGGQTRKEVRLNLFP